MESRYVTDCDCYLPEIEPLEGASVPSQADIFGVSGTVAERPDGYDPLALPALQPHLTDSYAYQGVVLAVFMANAGGAWDNAKKMVEEGHFGGKGSECHKATVVGDTVGDPFKDTSGPSLNILIKLMSMVSIVMAGLTVACHLF